MSDDLSALAATDSFQNALREMRAAEEGRQREREERAKRLEPVEELLRIGEMMSNVCWNLSQEAHPEGGRLEPRSRDVLRELWRNWDEVRRKFVEGKP